MPPFEKAENVSNVGNLFKCHKNVKKVLLHFIFILLKMLTLDLVFFFLLI